MPIKGVFVLKVMAIVGLWLLAVSSLNAETFRCAKDVPAYDSADPSKVIGTFQTGSNLELGEAADAKGMVPVSYRAPNGTIINALCRAEDVGKGKASNNPSSNPGGGKTAGEDSGFAKTEIYEKIQNLLVDPKGQPVKPSKLAKSKHVLLYFSAHWCPPCRAFTPELVKFYKRHEKQAMEVVFVSSDRSEMDQLNYMKELKMPWVAVKYDAISESQLKRFCGPGIPCLVALDERGAVVFDSYVNGEYVGPHKVLKDVEAKLR